MASLPCQLCGHYHDSHAHGSALCCQRAEHRIARLTRDLARWRKLCMEAEALLAKHDAEDDARKGCDHVRRVGWGGRWLCAGCGTDLGPCIVPLSEQAAATGPDRIADPHPTTQPAKEPRR